MRDFFSQQVVRTDERDDRDPNVLRGEQVELLNCEAPAVLNARPAHSGTDYALTLSRRHGKNMLRAVHVVDMTGEKVGTFTAVEWTGQTETRDGSRIWLLRCSCGQEKLMSLATFRRYQKAGCRPQCECDEYKRFGHGPREIKPRKPRRTREECSGKWSCQCAGLRHRVEGGRCSCGRTFQAEQAIAFEVPTLRSSMGRALDFAPGLIGLPRGGS
jgi:hypothetical protein